jgi:hypothetical protein
MNPKETTEAAGNAVAAMMYAATVRMTPATPAANPRSIPCGLKVGVGARSDRAGLWAILLRNGRFHVPETFDRSPEKAVTGQQRKSEGPISLPQADVQVGRPGGSASDDTSASANRLPLDHRRHLPADEIERVLYSHDLQAVCLRRQSQRTIMCCHHRIDSARVLPK